SVLVDVLLEKRVSESLDGRPFVLSLGCLSIDDAAHISRVDVAGEADLTRIAIKVDFGYAGGSLPEQGHGPEPAPPGIGRHAPHADELPTVDAVEAMEQLAEREPPARTFHALCDQRIGLCIAAMQLRGELAGLPPDVLACELDSQAHHHSRTAGARAPIEGSKVRIGFGDTDPMHGLP